MIIDCDFSDLKANENFSWLAFFNVLFKHFILLISLLAFFYNDICNITLLHEKVILTFNIFAKH